MPTPATRFAATGARLATAPGDAMTTVLSWLAQQRPARLGVAVSGGSDSVALLAWALAETAAEVHVLTFNHGVRGDAGAADAAWVLALARELGFTGHTATAPPWSEPPGEADLRRARYAWFRTMATTHDLGAILLGHHADDADETLLLRLARGSDSAGLVAPRPVHRRADGLVLLRPLLDHRKATLATALQEHDLSWRQDATNQDVGPLRNWLRAAVLPAWSDRLASGAREAGFARSRQLLGEDDAALDAWLDTLFTLAPPPEPTSFAKLRDQPVALRRRALRSFAQAHDFGAQLTGGVFDAWVEHLSAPTPVDATLTDGRRLVWDGACLHVASAEDMPAATWTDALLPVGGTVVLPDGQSLTARLIALDDAARTRLAAGKIDPAREVWLDPAVVADGPLRLRRWQPGDRYHPLGAPGRRKLQDCFTDRRIPVRERHRRPLVCLHSGSAGGSTGPGAILWVPGLLPAQTAALAARAESALRLTYRADTANDMLF